MDEPRNVSEPSAPRTYPPASSLPADNSPETYVERPSTAQLEDFHTDGVDALSGVPDATGDSVGIDTPGVGNVRCLSVVHGREYVPGEVPEPLRRELLREERNRLFIKLMYVAKRLADAQIFAGALNHEHCAECRQMNAHDHRLQHLGFCRVAEVFSVLADLEKMGDAGIVADLTEEEIPGSDSAVGLSELDGKPLALHAAYGEPWRPGALSIRRVIDRESAPICTTLPESLPAAESLRDRIISCVNYCAGVPDELLRDLRPEVAVRP